MPGHLIWGNLRTFTSDRVGTLLGLPPEYPDIVATRFALREGVCVNAPHLAHEVLTTKADAFVKDVALSIFLRPLLGSGLLTSEHEFHARQRKLLAPAFAHKRIASYADTMAERARRFADEHRQGEVVDMAEGMMRLTLEIVGKTLFDAEIGNDAEDVGEAVTTAMECVLTQLNSALPIPPIVPTPSNLKHWRAVSQLDAIIYRLIRERRAQGVDRGDVLSMLLEARDERGEAMPDRQVRDEAMTLFLAGHETTANALAWTLYLLARNPDARARVEDEIDALGRVPSYEDLVKLPVTLAAIKETMRIYPPAYLLARHATRRVDIGPYVIQKNSVVFLNIIGIQRRADIFEEPNRYRLDRFLGDAEKALPRCAYFPFGAGPRICIGNHFATMEAHILLATLLSRLRFDLVSDGPVACEPLVTLRPKGGLHMRVTVRRSDM